MFYCIGQQSKYIELLKIACAIVQMATYRSDLKISTAVPWQLSFKKIERDTHFRLRVIPT